MKKTYIIILLMIALSKSLFPLGTEHIENSTLSTFFDYYYMKFPHKFKNINPTITPYYRNSLPTELKPDTLLSKDNRFYKYGNKINEFYFKPAKSVRFGFNSDLKLIKRDNSTEENKIRFEIEAKMNVDFFKGEYVMRFRAFKNDNPEYQYRIRDWKGAFVKLEEAYLFYPFSKRFNIKFGRFYQNWAPYPFTSAIISDHAYAWDGLSYTFKASPFFYTFIVSQLDPYVKDDEEFDRHLIGHRIDWKPIPSLLLSVSETTVCTDFNYHMGYIVPFYAFYPIQWAERKNDNMILSFDAYYIWKEWGFFAQMFMDDIQYEDDPYPDKYCYLLGIKKYFAFKKSIFSTALSYRKASKWTYSHVTIKNRYTLGDTYIGGDMGADAYEVELKSIWERKEIKWENNLLYGKYGEGNDFSNTLHPFESLVDQSDEHPDHTPEFPSGIVEQKIAFKSKLMYYYSEGVQFYFQAETTVYDNYKNIEGDSCTINDFTLGVSINRF